MLVEIVRAAHAERCGPNTCDDLLIGLQLTHSGRFACPNEHGRREPLLVYRHPVLDPWIGIRRDDPATVLSDGDVRFLVDRFVQAAVGAERAGFDFVDIKHCHGYLGHEFLSAFDRPGPYGGDLAGRSRFLREIASGIRAEAPRLLIGVRLSLFDGPPFITNPSLKCGVPVPDLPPWYPIFGCNPHNPTQIDLREPIELLQRLQGDQLIDLVNFTAGIPYSNPHLLRPAAFPPSDGYPPPEDPLAGCVRQIDAAAAVKAAVPNLPAVGSAYTYFQEYLPHVAQAQVRLGRIDFVGIGRMVLSCWSMPDDVLSGRTPRRNLICRTFSDCTTAPRNGMASGCYPLDPAYKHSSEAARLESVLAARRTAVEGTP
jgi:2,4-dienoyl-CoA reductase-like NADH-dependent reductase (Old Yellow Enzyme family)